MQNELYPEVEFHHIPFFKPFMSSLPYLWDLSGRDKNNISFNLTVRYCVGAEIKYSKVREWTLVSLM